MLRALILAAALLVIPAFASAQWGNSGVRVDGYPRSDGTYVQPHMRSRPDASYNNNWSTSPNVNPYTGQQGTRQPRLYDGGSNPFGGSSTFGQPRSRSRW